MTGDCLRPDKRSVSGHFDPSSTEKKLTSRLSSERINPPHSLSLDKCEKSSSFPDQRLTGSQQGQIRAGRALLFPGLQATPASRSCPAQASGARGTHWSGPRPGRLTCPLRARRGLGRFPPRSITTGYSSPVCPCLYSTTHAPCCQTDRTLHAVLHGPTLPRHRRRGPPLVPGCFRPA